MTFDYCMSENVICSFESNRIKVKLVKAETTDGNTDLYYVKWKSPLGHEFINILKKPTNYRDASELYFEMTNTCMKSKPQIEDGDEY